MKKVFYILLTALLVCSAQSLFAAGDRADEVLKGLAAHIRGLGNYSVAFSVDTGDRTTTGSYTVGGDCYYMQIGDAEVYGDGRVRYEINNRTREVTIDVVDMKSRNILNNPTRAFDLVGDEFKAGLLWERDGQAVVKLTPKLTQSAMSTMTVTVDTQKMQPLTLAYDFDGDRVTITVQRFAAEKPAPKTFDRAAYTGYEIIDFR